MQTYIKEKLAAHKDDEYRIFASKLLPGVDTLLGVRIPILRRLAKEIARMDWRYYLQQASQDSFEEIMLQGMVIGTVEVETLEELLPYIQGFLPLIDNWSVCDSFCASLKIVKRNKREAFLFIQSYIYSIHPYEVRFAIVMLLNYYIEEEYLERLFSLFDQVQLEHYYVQMALGWAISACYVKFPVETLAYLKKHHLSSITYRMAIRKICESKKVSRADKEVIKQL